MMKYSPGVEKVIREKGERVLKLTLVQRLRIMLPGMGQGKAREVVEEIVEVTPCFFKGRLYASVTVCAGPDFGSGLGFNPELVQDALKELAERFSEDTLRLPVGTAVSVLGRDAFGRPEETVKLASEVTEQDVGNYLEAALQLAQAAEKAGAPWASADIGALKKLITYPKGGE